MDGHIFLERIVEKIERMTQRTMEMQAYQDELNQLNEDPQRQEPQVVVGANIFRYFDFARMGIEYAVESLKQERIIDTLKFHLLLARN